MYLVTFTIWGRKHNAIGMFYTINLKGETAELPESSDAIRGWCIEEANRQGYEVNIVSNIKIVPTTKQ